MNTFSKKSLACLLAAISFGFTATAQTGTTENKLFLASASSAHPNERPQWSKEQAEAWFKKVGPIKGINHPTPPCNAVSQDEALSLARALVFWRQQCRRLYSQRGECCCRSLEVWHDNLTRFLLRPCSNLHKRLSEPRKHGETNNPTVPQRRTYHNVGPLERAGNV